MESEGRGVCKQKADSETQERIALGRVSFLRLLFFGFVFSPSSYVIFTFGLPQMTTFSMDQSGSVGDQGIMRVLLRGRFRKIGGAVKKVAANKIVQDGRCRVFHTKR